MIKTSFKLDINFCELVVVFIGLSSLVAVIRYFSKKKTKMSDGALDADRDAEKSRKSYQKVQTGAKPEPKCVHSVFSNIPNVVKRSSKDHSETFCSSYDVTDVTSVMSPMILLEIFTASLVIQPQFCSKKMVDNDLDEVNVCCYIMDTESLSQNENHKSFNIKVTECQKSSSSKENDSSVKTYRKNYKLPQTDAKNNSANKL